MRLWYLLTTSILCVLLFCEAQNSKGLNSKPKASQLLRFFKLNNDISKKEDNRSDHSQEVITKENEENFHSRPPKCKLPKNCTEDAKSSTVKKSFRPHDYDYDDEDDDEDYDDFRSSNDYPEDDEFPEEDTIGSYRAFEDSPPRPRDPGPSAEDYEDDHESDYEFEDEPRDRPRYEDDLDQERDRWDWESPLRHHERARWRWHHPSYDANDGYERDFPPRFRHLPRRVHHRIHRNHHRHPAIQASYRTMEQAGPVSWPPISQGYRSITSSALGWTNGPATQTNLQSSPYLSPTTMQPVDSIGPRIINPYVQDAPSSPQAEINPFLVPRYPEQLPSALNLESTAQNFPGFSRTFPATTMSFPRVFHDTFHSPRLTPLMASRMRPFRRQLSRIFLRHGRFPYTIFNRIARRDETQ